MDKKSTYGLKLEQLTDLFSIGIENANPVDGICDDERIAGLLHNQLTTALPKGSFLLDSRHGSRFQVHGSQLKEN